MEPLHPKLNFPKHVFGQQQCAFLATWHRQYPWLHYLEEEDLVHHFYYAYLTYTEKSSQKLNLNTDSWSSSNSYSMSKFVVSLVHYVILMNSMNVGDMFSTTHVKKKADVANH